MYLQPGRFTYQTLLVDGKCIDLLLLRVLYLTSGLHCTPLYLPIIRYRIYKVYSVQFTVYSVQCTVYSVQFTVYSVQFTVYSLQCTVYSVQCSIQYMSNTQS